MAKKDRTFAGTGRRKSSVARVILTPGTGKITVNGRDVNEYMPFEVLVMDLKQPLEITNNLETFDVDVNVSGYEETTLEIKSIRCLGLESDLKAKTDKSIRVKLCGPKNVIKNIIFILIA